MITHERLKELLRYDPETGLWQWIKPTSPRCPKGPFPGCQRKRGDLAIRIDRVEYKAHRLAWLYMTGEWPPEQIDHKDLVSSNNRWTNLRLANNSQNQANHRVRSDSSTGVKGVISNPRSRVNPYHARITVNGKVIILGQFPTVEAASAAYLKAAKEVFGEFAHA